MNLLKYL